MANEDDGCFDCEVLDAEMHVHEAVHRLTSLVGYHASLGVVKASWETSRDVFKMTRGLT